MATPSPAGSPASSYTKFSLAVASLDIGRVLADRGGVTFSVKGTCMYPTIRPGDVLSIQSCPAADVSIGDIAVCRRSKRYLSCHRVIHKDESDGRAFIITRTDRSRHGMDEPTFDEDLLGVVTAITRKGQSVPLQPTAYPFPVRCYHGVCVAFLHAANRIEAWLTGASERLVQTGVYRSINRARFAFARSRSRYIVNVPLNAVLGDGVYRRFDPDTFDLRMKWKGKRIDRWTLLLQLGRARDPAARVTFVRSADDIDAWRVVESHVSMAYCGARLDDDLIRKAETIFARSSQYLRPLKSSNSPSGTS